jgi:hypothetical protein
MKMFIGTKLIKAAPMNRAKYPAQTQAIKGQFTDDMVPYREYWALKTAQNDIAVWQPSGSDSLANDWCFS